jgi:PST family polysaccharide transporter
MFSQTVGAKVLNFFGQLVLARFLVPEDLGLVTMAVTISFIASTTLQCGMDVILIRRAPQFGRIANPAFWICTAIAAVGILVTLAALPFALRYYQAPLVGWLVLLLLVKTLFDAVSIVPFAKLNIDFRFELLATVGFFFIAANTLLTILLAWLKWGPFAVVAPMAVVAVARALVGWRLARPPVRLAPEVRYWGSLLGESAVLMASAVLVALHSQGDYLALALFRPDDKHGLGMYWYAYNLSTQTLQMVSVTMASVLLPALSALQANAHQQHAAFRRAAAALVTLGVPLCFLQAAVARPLIHLLFKPAWADIVPLFQILSVGMGLSIIGTPGRSMLQAQGRLRGMLVMYVVCDVLFVACVLAGVGLGQTRGVAVGVAAYLAISGPFIFRTAIRPTGGGWSDAWQISVKPVLFAALSIAAGMFAYRMLPDPARSDVAEVVVVPAVSLCLYAAAVRYGDPETWRDLITPLRRLLPARGQSARAA